MLHVTPTPVKNVTLAYIGEEPETQMQPKKGAIGKKSEPFYKMAKRYVGTQDILQKSGVEKRQFVESLNAFQSLR